MSNSTQPDYKELYERMEVALDGAISGMAIAWSECQVLLEACGERESTYSKAADDRFDALLRKILNGGSEDNRLDYKKMYYMLFNAITTALHHIDKQDYDEAKMLLILAQQRTEEIYMSSAEE